MQPFKPLIGLCGYAQSGKDTVAAILIEQFGYRRVAFADELKAMAISINPVVRISGIHGVEVHELQQVVDRQGWEEAKRHPDVRMFLQNVGSAIRGQVSKDYWIRRMLEANNLDSVTIHSAGIVVTDVRHLNEIDWILDPLGTGVLWRVNRPGVSPINNHVSEAEWTTIIPDVVINNSGSLQYLHQQVVGGIERGIYTTIN